MIKPIQVYTPQPTWLEHIIPRLRDMRKTIEYYVKTNLQASGFTTIVEMVDNNLIITDKHINYDLRSWDGGKNWYAVNDDYKYGLTILGPVNEIYPLLRQSLEFWQNINLHST